MENFFKLQATNFFKIQATNFFKLQSVCLCVTLYKYLIVNYLLLKKLLQSYIFKLAELKSQLNSFHYNVRHFLGSLIFCIIYWGHSFSRHFASFCAVLRQLSPVSVSRADEPRVVDAKSFTFLLVSSVDQILNDRMVEAVVNVKLSRTICEWKKDQFLTFEVTIETTLHSRT